MEEYTIKHLTKAGKRWVLHGTVPNDEAVEVDQAIEKGLPLFYDNKSKLMRESVKNNSLEPVYQGRVELALDICDELVSPDVDGAINDAYAHQVKVIRMALLGCATKMATEFTGELSREYIERYGDE